MAVDHAENRWAEVGTKLRAQMKAAGGMNQKALCAATGLSPETVRPVMQGRANKLKEATLAKISVAVGWTADSIERILDGREPILTGKAASDARLDAVEDRWADHEHRLRLIEELLADELPARARPDLRIAADTGSPDARSGVTGPRPHPAVSGQNPEDYGDEPSPDEP